MTTPSQIKGHTRARAPHAPGVMRGPLFVAVREGSGKSAYWANKDNPHEIQMDGYSAVRYEELETLPGGTYTPHDKDFGVFWDVAGFNKKDVVRQGSHILMWARKEQVDARRQEEAERMKRLQPRRSDPGEKAKLHEEAETTLGKEADIT